MLNDNNVSWTDALFPDDNNCIICDRELRTKNRYAVCSSCMCKLTFIENQCLKCGKAVDNEALYCAECKDKSREFDVVYSCFRYWGEIKTAVRGLKYGNKRYLVKYFASFLFDKYLEKGICADVITWVSMHESKRIIRGYDQARLLAEALARKLNLPCEKSLKCVKLHKEFARLTAAKRKELSRSAFTALNRYDGKTVLIIDDVLTTGSTMDAAAYALKQAGAAAVFGLTLCNTPLFPKKAPRERE